MSRYSLCISVKSNERLGGVKESFLALFREYSLPNSVLCDNGPPFGTSVYQGYTKFEVFLMDYGISPVHGRPLHPQTQGKCERFHRTLKRELLDQTTIGDIPHAQREFDIFRRVYNEERPHCSLGYAVPAERYTISSRAMPKRITQWEYPTYFQVRKVCPNGYIHFRNTKFFFSLAFVGRDVALAETQEDGVVDIVYRNFKIATIDLKCKKYILRKIKRIN